MPGIRIRRDSPNVQFGHTLLSVKVGAGLEDVEKLKQELLDYTDVLLGRAPSPIESPYLEMQEVAAAYHARAREIEMMIHNLEDEGIVMRGSPLYNFRNGSLRSFLEMTKRLHELGSRRLAQEELLYRARLDGSKR